mmetsp:Transcript_14488/g.47605  ORF Transcript_14488/g.47605 Transcript_14488/m.47605 type:complete len:208 (-) Transcript_14488:85-708(-)
MRFASSSTCLRFGRLPAPAVGVFEAELTAADALASMPAAAPTSRYFSSAGTSAASSACVAPLPMLCASDLAAPSTSSTRRFGSRNTRSAVRGARPGAVSASASNWRRSSSSWRSAKPLKRRTVAAGSATSGRTRTRATCSSASPHKTPHARGGSRARAAAKTLSRYSCASHAAGLAPALGAASSSHSVAAANAEKSSSMWVRTFRCS